MDRDALDDLSLPEVTVDSSAALERTLRRGRHRQRTRRVAFGAALGVCVAVAAGAAAIILAAEDGDLEVASRGPTSSTTTTAATTVPVSGAPATWRVDPADPPAPERSTFSALVTRLGCAGGETGEVLPPEIETSTTEIRVRFTVEPIDGRHTCPGNNDVSYVVDLGAPLGDRTLVDSACTGSGSGPDSAPCADGATRWPGEPTAPAPTSPQDDAEAGDLATASKAIREACRRFYGYDVDLDEPTGTTLITEAQAVERCDAPTIQFRDDCYAERPPSFVPGVGGCADLGGYLAVYHLAPPEGGAPDELYRFSVGEDVWWIYPESD